MPVNFRKMLDESPVANCDTCQALWIQKNKFRDMWLTHPHAIEYQNLLTESRNAFLEHRKTHQANTGPIILTNEQPVEGCKDCAILWYQLLTARNQFRMRPTEHRVQDAFDNAQDAFLQHYKDEHQQGEIHS